MQFAIQMQDALMRVEWDEALLKTPWANEQRRPDGVLLFRGLRMNVGMCTGERLAGQGAMWGSCYSSAQRRALLLKSDRRLRLPMIVLGIR